mgnify:FL=1
MTSAQGKLSTYEAKRDFRKTGEPEGKIRKSGKSDLIFSVQKHDASTLHYDLRLEWDGVLLSWAITRGPSIVPDEKRLAVRTEDHPVDYAGFEGIIPKDQYGGGTVMLWDRGTWQPDDDPDNSLENGKLDFTIRGERMKGNWSLIRMRKKDEEKGKREDWLLVKQRDRHAGRKRDRLVTANPNSVKTGRSLKAIAKAQEKAKP